MMVISQKQDFLLCVPMIANDSHSLYFTVKLEVMQQAADI